MIFGLSSQLFYPHKLGTAHLDALAESGVQVIELFAARHHVDYTDRRQTRELAAWFRDRALAPTLHAPLSFDEQFSRHAPATLNLVALEKPRRLEAMEEIKRALELAETIPATGCVLHLGLSSSDEWSDYTLEHALTAIEHLTAFAAPLGVRLLLENLPNPIATPAHLLEILRAGHFDRCGLCLDVAHVHLSEEPIAEVIELLRPRIAELHLSDNDGRTGTGKDAHLWPASGSERPAGLARGTIDWFNLYAALDSLPAATPAILEIADSQAASLAEATRIAREVLAHAARLRENIPESPV